MAARPLQVLLLEDNPGDARLIAEAVAEADGAPFTLEQVDRLATALARLDQGGVDIILSDLTVPDSTGWNTFVRLRAHASNVPIVVISGLDDEELAVRAVREGAQDYLVNGQVDGRLLVRAIRYAVERKQGEVERARLLASLRETNQQLVLANLHEQELADAERRHAAEVDATFASVADGLVIYGPAGEIVRLNPAAESLLGYSPATLSLKLGERIEQLHAETRDGKPLSLEDLPVSRALRGETTRGTVMVLRRPFGKPCWVSISAAPVRDADGRLLGAVTSLTDITALHELQEQQEDFVRTISHDLRQPLTPIIGQAQLLEARLAAVGQQRDVHSVQVIVKSAKRMNVMISDLVESVRLEAGRLELRREPTDLFRLVVDIVGRLGTEAERQRIRVERLGSVPAVAVDPERMERAIVNLITNALKYSPPASPVVVRLNAHNGEAVVAVIDRGVGIPAADLPHLFTRFYRSPAAKRSEGLGLGLYIARLIVEAHNGRISVESTPGVGSTFSFTLPVA